MHGFGVFAAETIPKHTRIIDYAGELIRNDEECEAREARYLADGCTWIFKVNRAWSRDANVGGNIARFINHSCAPNSRHALSQNCDRRHSGTRARAGKQPCLTGKAAI